MFNVVWLHGLDMPLLGAG